MAGATFRGPAVFHGAAFKHFFVAGPWFVRGAAESVDCESFIWVAEKGGVEDGLD